MSEVEPSVPYETGEVAARPWWRRRLVLPGVGAGVAVAVAVTAAVVLSGGSERGDSGRVALVAPKRGIDSVPAGTRVTKFPDKCGVTARMARSLVGENRGDYAKSSIPNADGKGSIPSEVCQWTGRDDLGDHDRRRPAGDGQGGLGDRRLRVTFSLCDSDGDAMTRFLTPYWLGIEDSGATLGKRDPRSTVMGLGDEASVIPRVHPDANDGATVVFRAGNAVIEVAYSQPHTVGRAKLSTQAATAGALKSATEIARRLGVAAKPRTGDPVTPPAAPSVRNVPAARVALPGEIIQTLTPGAQCDRSFFYGPFDGIPQIRPDVCARSSFTHTENRESQKNTVVVAIAAFPSPADRPGFGPWTAAYHYTRLHRLARHGGRDFQPVAGLGEQAFSSSRLTPSLGAAVIFRLRNVLVAVHYSITIENKNVDAGKQLRGAYTAAQRIAGKLTA